MEVTGGTNRGWLDFDIGFDVPRFVKKLGRLDCLDLTVEKSLVVVAEMEDIVGAARDRK